MKIYYKYTLPDGYTVSMSPKEAAFKSMVHEMVTQNQTGAAILMKVVEEDNISVQEVAGSLIINETMI